MNDVSVTGKKSISPGEMLKLQREMEAKTRAYADLGLALQNGDVVGDQVSRLHKLIGGTTEERQHAEMELALTRMLNVHHRLAMTPIREIGR